MLRPLEHPPEERHRLRNFALDIASTLFIAASGTMLADFSRRLLGSDLDSVGVASIAVQAFFVLAASSAFTDGGWTALCNILKHFTRRNPDKTLWRFGLSLLLLAVTMPIWYWLPAQLALYYNNTGFNLNDSAPDRALRNYQRAIALDPSLHEADVNMGGVLETFYRYDEAEKAYEDSITTNPADTVPYNNLARLLVRSGNPIAALRITDDALSKDPTDKSLLSTLHENRAAAEFDLGLYKQATDDATQSTSAGGDCVLGKIYEKQGQPTQAQNAWDSFTRRILASPESSQYLQPDCIILAEDHHEKN